VATAYIVTQGEYSDYKIVAVFSTRELAEAFLRVYDSQGTYDSADIEEHEIDPHQSEINAGLKVYEVTMDIDGNNAKAELNSDPDAGTEFYILRNYQQFYGRTTCWARDEQHAIKIANERRIVALLNDTQASRG
jgi:hypothetical protein